YLIPACQSGNIPVVHCLLEKGADPNFRDLNRRTPLGTAIVYAKTMVTYGGSNLTEAQRRERQRISREMVRLLRDHGARPTLIQAAELDDIVEVEALLSASIPADWMDQYDPTALCVAASHGNLEMMRLLQVHGADINHPPGLTGMTPLGSAASA